MKMRPYIVRKHEHLDQIAFNFGFDADTVWNDEKNRRLRESGRSPNLLCAGDILHIPEQKTKWAGMALEESNPYGAKVTTSWINLVFEDGGQAVANEPCIIGLGGVEKDAMTSGGGSLSFEMPHTHREGYVFFPRLDKTYIVQVGLDPVQENSGRLERLGNLGLRELFSSVEGHDLMQSLAALVANPMNEDEFVADITSNCTADGKELEHLATRHGV